MHAACFENGLFSSFSRKKIKEFPSDEYIDI